MSRNERIKKALELISDRVFHTDVTDYEITTVSHVVELILTGETLEAERLTLNFLGWTEVCKILQPLNSDFYKYA